MLLRNSVAKYLRSLKFTVTLSQGHTLTYNNLVLVFCEKTRYVTVYVPYVTAIRMSLPYQVHDRLINRIDQHLHGLNNRKNNFPFPRSPAVPTRNLENKYCWMVTCAKFS